MTAAYLFAVAGVPDGPFCNAANSPETGRKRNIYRRGVEDAAPYDSKFGFSNEVLLAQYEVASQ